MGLSQGRARALQIQRTLARYDQLRQTRWGELVDVRRECSHPEAFFGADELDELRGIADGAGVAPAEIIAHNIRLYIDAGVGGCQFALAAEANGKYGLLHAANEELQRGMRVQDVLERNVFVRHPQGQIPYVTFGTDGQVGGLNGVNAYGLTLSTTCLLDLDSETALDEGRLHTVLVKNILERAQDIDAAVEIFKRDPGRIPYTLCLTHFPDDRLCHIEYDLNLLKVLPWTPDVISTNHRLMRTFPGDAPSPSRERCERLRQQLGGDVPAPIDAARAMSLLRDRFDPIKPQPDDQATTNTICRVDNRFSVLFQPQRGSLWVTADLSADKRRDVSHRLSLNELLPGYPLTAPRSTAPKAEASLPTVEDSRVGRAVAQSEMSVPDAAALPLIDAVPEFVEGRRLVAESYVDPLTDVFLTQHQFKKRPLMPLVVMVEALAEAATLLAGKGKQAVGVRDVTILGGLRFHSDNEQTIRVAAARDASEIKCELTCDVRNQRGDVLLEDKQHLRGTVDVDNAADGQRLPARDDLPAAPDDPTRWVRCFYTENIVIYHGPVFRCLRQLAIDDTTAWACITAIPVSKFNGDRAGDGWHLNPGVLDACLYACGSFLWLKCRGVIAVPDGFERLRWGRSPRPGERCLLTITDRGREGNHTFYDFSLAGDDGETLLDVVGYRNMIVAEEPSGANPKS